MTAPEPTLPAPSPRPLRIGLTGGIGSGKSLVAGLFVQQGAALVDTDAIAHQLTGPGGAAIPAIRAAFGDGAIAADGRMDRDAMRARVFAHPALRHKLEAILHPMIQQQALEQLAAAEQAGAPCLLVAVPLLLETGHWARLVDRILVVDCPENRQLARVMARAGLPEAQVRAIMAAQASRSERLAAADDVIDNSGSIGETAAQVEQLFQRYLEHRPSAPAAPAGPSV